MLTTPSCSFVLASYLHFAASDKFSCKASQNLIKSVCKYRAYQDTPQPIGYQVLQMICAVACKDVQQCEGLCGQEQAVC